MRPQAVLSSVPPAWNSVLISGTVVLCALFLLPVTESYKRSDVGEFIASVTYIPPYGVVLSTLVTSGHRLSYKPVLKAVTHKLLRSGIV